MKLRLQLGCKRLADYKSEPPMMSKQIVRVLALLTVLSLLTGSVLISGRAVPAGSQRAGIATGTARRAAIEATTAAELEETSSLRQLSILRQVKRSAQSCSGFEGLVVK